MHFVNKPLPQVLLNHIDPAQDTNILSAGRFAGAFQCHMNAFCNKMECSSAFHWDRGSRMMSEYEYRSVIGWVLSPPSFPAIIRPLAPAKREHISPENSRPNIGKASRRKIIVSSFISSLASIHFVKGGSLDHPVV